MDIRRCNGSFLVVLILLCMQFSSSQPPDTLWTRTYGTENDDWCLSGRQTFDGGYIATGEVWISGGWNGYLLKTDSLGDSLWMKLYNFGSGHDVQQTADSGYVVLLIVPGPDICLLKTDKDGDSVWTQNYGGDWVHSMEKTDDEGYIIVGETDDVYLIKTDSLGGTLWTKTYGGMESDVGYAVKQTNDDGYIVVGRTRSFGAGYYDVYLIKTDVDGDTLWTRVYGGTDYDAGVGVFQTTDGGYMVAASTNSFGAGNGDMWLLMTDSLGDTLWTRTYGTIDGENCISMAPVDNGYVLTGCKGLAGSYDIWLVRIDSAGDTLWTCTFGGTESDGPTAVRQTTDDGFIIFGMTYSFGAGYGDIYMVKTAPEVGIGEEKATNIPGSYYGATVVSGPLRLPDGRECKVIDITGRVVDPNEMTRGIYFIEVDGAVTHKVVKIR